MKSLTKHLLASAVLVGTISSAHAVEPNQTVNTQTNTAESRQTQTEQLHLQWGLTQNEYARYENLMKGIRGSISPDSISPLEVLGIHARSDAERDRYAKMWADQMEKDAERVLAFQRAYDEAWAQKGGSIIDIAAIHNQRQPTNAVKTRQPQQQPGNALTFITRLADCPSCDQKLQQLMTSMIVDKTMVLNIYFSDSKGKENSRIRQWAVKNKVDASMLQSKRITLNHGDTLMKKHQVEESQLPVVFN